jgi:hypothetical protein
MRASSALLALALVASTAGCGMVQARVIDKDGKQYNLDGTARVQPAERARLAMEAMKTCAADVARAERAFTADAIPAFTALAGAGGAADGARISFADADPLVRVERDPRGAARRAAKAKASHAPPAAAPAPYEPAAAALSATIRASLDTTERCSAANLDAVRVVKEEARYLRQPQTHELLEEHWRATQRLARAKELGVTAIALALAMQDAALGKPAALGAVAKTLSSGDPLFVDVPFDHDLRREVLLQAMRDTDESCGKPGATGQSACESLLGMVRQAQNAVGAVKDVQSGRVAAALEKASNLADGGDAQAAADRARREAVIALIPEKPALDTLGGVLARARDGRGHDARALGSTLASSDGVAQLLKAGER